MSHDDDAFYRLLDTAKRPAPKGDLSAGAQAALSAFRAQSKVVRWTRDALVLLGINFLLVALCMVSLSWTTAAHRNEAVTALGLVLLAALIGCGSVLAILPGRHFGGALQTALAVAVMLLTLVGASQNMLSRSLLAGWGCARFEAVLALLPMLGVWWATRKFAFDATRVALAASAASAVGYFGLHFHCPDGMLLHLLLFHIAPVPVLIGVALLVRRSLSSTTFAP
jgi:hypothetical protein